MMQYKKYIIRFFLIIGLITALYGFYAVNETNYIQQKNIEAQIINHPDGIPTSEAAKLSSFGFMNMMADIYWLRTVQYIGGNVISGEYKKYLAVMMNLVTNMNPYFEAPYTIGQLIIPSSDGAYEDTKNPDNLKDYKDGEALGLKGIENFCDVEKINLIIEEENLAEIINNEKYKNPCKSFKIPYYLAYIYYFYLKENINAANYYKIVSAQEDAPEGARVLAAIMQGKGGDREKSLYMFLSLAENTSSDGEACGLLTSEVQAAYNYISSENLELNGQFIANIQAASELYLPTLSEENEQDVLADTQCTNFLAKAIREINLMYIEQADEKYVLDHPDEVSAMTPGKLYEEGYINFIPTDYQQYEDRDYGIIYRYNEDIGRFDYEMGTKN